MLKKELAKNIQKHLDGTTQKDCCMFIDAFVKVVTEALARGEEVKLIDFGVFGAQKRTARKCVTPCSNGVLHIDEAVLPHFKAGKKLRDAVKGSAAT